MYWLLWTTSTNPTASGWGTQKRVTQHQGHPSIVNLSMTDCCYNKKAAPDMNRERLSFTYFYSHRKRVGHP
jgi:hypothetical protein